MTDQEIRKIATRTIDEEQQAIKSLRKSVNDDFIKVVRLILNSNGRVIVTGIGKSATIANKIVATLNSTGTPSVFMHAADAVHGDLGMVEQDDVVLCLSKSGNSPEIKVLVPFLKLRGNTLVGMIGNRDSYLAKQSDYTIDTTVSREACPNNLAPTSSTTAQLVMGDALAVSLLECRGFSSKDFAKFHPGGALGKKLYMKVSDLYVHNEVPKVDAEDDLKHTIFEISSKRLGATAVMKEDELVGIITDGDLRRMLQRSERLDNVKARDVMTPSPKTIASDTLVSDALDMMRSRSITQLLVTNNDVYVGVIHLHDILKEGIL
ncbi:MAG: KpsF/GutQ family sugar-phosphate isomerase [Bacteroidales bacterium]|nr:KpsF/GutQ family sugar-phosphate isomerase [Bacteroidales bacterium]